MSQSLSGFKVVSAESAGCSSLYATYDRCVRSSAALPEGAKAAPPLLQCSSLYTSFISRCSPLRSKVRFRRCVALSRFQLFAATFGIVFGVEKGGKQSQRHSDALTTAHSTVPRCAVSPFCCR